MPFIPELLNFLCDVFVETGTFEGDTINIVSNNDIFIPSTIISLELSDVFLHNCKKRFINNSNIVIHKGNSKYDLYDKIKDIPTKITFWLDSHWSGTPNVGCDPIKICPIIEELDQIKKHKLITHTIMIDDIRLMNNSSNKFIGFPVTKEEILKKLFDINPNYTIRYFDDCQGKNDILVAYIEEIEEKRCIHNYLTKCYTNPQPPGFADFLRGTIALYNFSEKYGYKLYICGDHPVFNCFKPNKNIVYNNYKTKEFLPPLSYNDIYLNLDSIFKLGNSFSVMTNSFYTINKEGIVNFGDISKDCAEYIKDILSPSTEVENKVKYVFNTEYKINMDDHFKVIHLRFGDIFLNQNIYDDNLYNLYYNKIITLISKNKIENENEKYVLISDSSKIAQKLKMNIPDLLYWDNSKIHLGDLMNLQTSNILDTIVDFFIISNSNEIISNGSGFSKINSIIYNIKYTYL